jgi:hypothetical protein
MKKIAHFRRLALLIFCFGQLLTVSCSGQIKKVPQEKTAPAKPDIRYKVNREVDKHGNLIRYDSSYSYSYHSGVNDTLAEKLLKGFQADFFKSSGNRFNFLNDSLFFNDGFDDKLFDQFFRQEQEMMRGFEPLTPLQPNWPHQWPAPPAEQSQAPTKQS